MEPYLYFNIVNLYLNVVYKYILICKHKYKYLDFNSSTHVYTQSFLNDKVHKINMLYCFPSIRYRKTHSFRQ